MLPSCSSKGKVSSTVSGGERQEHVLGVGRLSGVQGALVAEAESWLGTPYLYAGAQKGVGADCSGLVMKVFESAAGFELPRNSAKQAEFCSRLEREDVQPGDLVFFATGKNHEKVNHVGIMVDADRFIHASSSKGVCVSSMASDYYVRAFRMFGRVPQLTAGH